MNGHMPGGWVLVAGALLAPCLITGCSAADPTLSATGCAPSLTDCDGTCVDTDVTRAHCGACGEACDDGEICDGTGSCASSCAAGSIECDGLCVDPNTDEAHCGGCDSSCAAGELCDGSGLCALSCQAGSVLCDGTCVDPSSDEAYCGAGPDCDANPGSACAAGELCDGNGTCVLSCQQGLIDCDGTCIDPMVDEAHCGAGPDCSANSGVACDAGEVCNGNGTCALSCQAGLVDCNGKCIDPNTDEVHCGAGANCAANPGMACDAGQVCDGTGICATTCQPWAVMCFGQCVDPYFNNQFCGAGPNCDNNPGMFCPPGTGCQMGFCEVGPTACPPGQVDCAGQCVDPLTDNQFCGADGFCNFPGVACQPGFVCSNGSCELSCQQGLIDCSGTCTDPLTDEQHCGAGLDCSINPGTQCEPWEVCDGTGTCAVNCPPGWQPCLGGCIDPNVSTCPCNPTELLCNAACTDPDTDPAHCGAVGNCTGQNAGVACQANELCVGGNCCEDCGGMGCCAAGHICSAGVCIQPLVNGSFENGFTGWVTQDLLVPFFPLGVHSTGFFGPFIGPLTPTDGSFAVVHGFDGDGVAGPPSGGPGEIFVAQDVTLGAGPTIDLTFDYRAGWDNFGLLPRAFEVHIEPSGGGAPLQVTTELTAPPMSMVVDTGILSGSVNLDAFAGQSIRIKFIWFIPEAFSGPAEFMLDDVAIN